MHRNRLDSEEEILEIIRKQEEEERLSLEFIRRIEDEEKVKNFVLSDK